MATGVMQDIRQLRVTMISANPQLVARFNKLCGLLCYQFTEMGNEVASIPNLVIIDSINTSEQIIRHHLSAIPLSVPLLWVIDQASALSQDNRLLLRSPFTIEEAIESIQLGLQEGLRVTTDLSEHFTYQLMLSNSPQDILELTSQYLVEEFEVVRVGILDTSGDHWLYWQNPPPVQMQDDFVAYLWEVDQKLTHGWLKLPFNSGEINGIMFVECTHPMGRAEMALLRDTASVAAKVFSREIALHYSQEYIKSLQTFDLLGQSIVANLEDKLVFQNIVVSAQNIVHAQGCSLWLTRQEKFVLTAQTGHPRPKHGEVYIDDHVFGQVLETRMPDQRSKLEREPFLYEEGAIEQAILVPLYDRDKPMGVICCLNASDGFSFSETDIWRLRNLASWAVIALINADLHKRSHMALERERVYRDRLIQMEKVTALGQLVASVAHEVNNPLQVIQAGLDTFVRSQSVISAEMDENLNMMQQSIDQIIQVIDRIRSHYKVPEQYPTLTNLNQLIASTVNMVQLNIDNHDVKITLALDETLPEISCFEHEMRQVFLNLLQNALDAVREDGEIHIRTDFISESDLIDVTISDNGIGIPPEMLDMIFDIFYTSKPNGSGIGLAVTKDILMQHGGQITAESQQGRGTTLHITLPAN